MRSGKEVLILWILCKLFRLIQIHCSGFHHLGILSRKPRQSPSRWF